MRVGYSYDAGCYKFTGKERDTESGIDYFGARYMASSMERFMSPDPLLNSGGPDNPQTRNWYSYTLNNPLTITGASSFGHEAGHAQEAPSTPPPSPQKP